MYQHLVQTALPTHNLNTNNINLNRNTPAIVQDDSNDDSPIHSQRTSPPCHHLICPLQNRPLTCNQLKLCSAHMINCVIWMNSFPHLHFALVHVHFIAGMHSRLNASSWKQSLHPLNPLFTSLAPSSTTTQAMPLNTETL
jgi:hypothetical protein